MSGSTSHYAASMETLTLEKLEKSVSNCSLGLKQAVLLSHLNRRGMVVCATVVLVHFLYQILCSNLAKARIWQYSGIRVEFNILVSIDINGLDCADR